MYFKVGSYFTQPALGAINALEDLEENVGRKYQASDFLTIFELYCFLISGLQNSVSVRVGPCFISSGYPLHPLCPSI